MLASVPSAVVQGAVVPVTDVHHAKCACAIVLVALHCFGTTRLADTIARISRFVLVVTWLGCPRL